jgi:uncharacterized protein
VSLDGKTFFYPNPLESNGQHERSPWFGVACCPGNLTRFLASVPGYVYATQRDALFVNLYAQGTADIDMDGGKVKIAQETRYPWDGSVKFTVTPDRMRAFAIKLRVPGWARNEPVPSDLYRFMDAGADADAAKEPIAITVNGKPAEAGVLAKLDKGYASIARTWRAGDTIELTLPMPVRRVVAHEQVAADSGRVALQRGPIVFAAEWPDNANGKVRNLVLSDSAALTSEFRADLLNGVQVVKSKAVGLSRDANGQVVKTDQDFVAIPYAMWANRGRGQMSVWIARNDALAAPTPFPTVATTSKVTTSGRKYPGAINDGEAPASSSDSKAYFDWWPRKGTTEWVEYALAKPATVSEVEVYWFDDTGRGQVRVPASWRVLYNDAGEWKPVEAAGAYGVDKDRFNTITFKPVETSKLRLEVTMQKEWSAGLQEWRVK